MDCFDDQYDSVNDWFAKRAQLVMVDPNMDGTNTQLQLMSQQDIMQKANMTATTAGGNNPQYDWGIFLNYATAQSTFGALHKEPWRRQGYRAVTTASASSDIGVSEGQAVGSTVVPTFTEVTLLPKEIELPTGQTSKAKIMEQISDAVTWPDIKAAVQEDFYTSLNYQLVLDANTLAGYNFESVDRLIGSYSEAAGSGYGTGDHDPWTEAVSAINRDSTAGWYDSYVSHGSTVDRDLSISLIAALEVNCIPRWKTLDNKFYLTGLDTAERWGQLESSKQRFGNDKFTISVGDGIQTASGEQAGFKLATWNGHPIIQDSAINTDTISRIYLIDSDYFGIAWGLPPTFTESDDMFVTGHIRKGVWYGIGELYCTNFGAQGKLRDLQ
jgi:hypothetical protein